MAPTAHRLRHADVFSGSHPQPRFGEDPPSSKNYGEARKAGLPILNPDFFPYSISNSHPLDVLRSVVKLMVFVVHTPMNEFVAKKR
jgi:hypothetical protein